ncbi:hypothetical protein [Cardiobacterium valvarum]|uniref:hypothetical protein n=1 Tax=Cardiobacterium valvarum TaxID=194702 RepID=UPI0035E4AB49
MQKNRLKFYIRPLINNKEKSCGASHEKGIVTILTIAVAGWVQAADIKAGEEKAVSVPPATDPVEQAATRMADTGGTRTKIPGKTIA